MNKRSFLRNLAGGTAGLATLAAMPGAVEARPALPKRHRGHVSSEDRRRARFPNVPLIDHEGKIVRFYDDLMKDKTVMINFMYARCGDTCPGTTVNLKKVQKELGDRVGRDIFMYSITLEPEHDTVEKLADYASLFKVRPGWRFLTGRREDIEVLRRKLGFVNPDPALDKDRTQHIGALRFGVEPLERWALCPALGNPKYIARYVEWMEPNGLKPDLTEMG